MCLVLLWKLTRDTMIVAAGADHNDLAAFILIVLIYWRDARG